MDGADCATQGTATESWSYTYDGNEVRVMEVYALGSTDQYTKHYFAGGMYEVEINHILEPDVTTTKKYYSIAGMRVAMDDGANLTYFASDHLSSTSISLDASGTFLSEQRYTPFGELHTDVGTILTPTDSFFITPPASSPIRPHPDPGRWMTGLPANRPLDHSTS